MPSNQGMQRIGEKRTVLCGMVGVGLTFLSAVPVMAQAQERGYTVFWPDGPGPHPGVVFLSGCNGLRPKNFAEHFYEEASEKLRAMGFVVVWADYLARRNLRSCARGITQLEAARDAVEAASWLRSQSYIDGKRITVMGWSYGGGAVLLALGSFSVEELIFTRAIVYYPSCRYVGLDPRPWTHRVPLLVLQAGSDNIAYPEMCKGVLEKSAEKGDIKVVTYPGALHAFDMSELPPRKEVWGGSGTVGYHPQAAAAAWEEVQRFLAPAK